MSPNNRVNEFKLLFHFHLRGAYTNNCLVHSRVWGHMVGGSKTYIKSEHWIYSLMGRIRIVYGSIKIFQFNLIIILIVLFLLYEIQ